LTAAIEKLNGERSALSTSAWQLLLRVKVRLLRLVEEGGFEYLSTSPPIHSKFTAHLGMNDMLGTIGNLFQ